MFSTLGKSQVKSEGQLIPTSTLWIVCTKKKDSEVFLNLANHPVKGKPWGRLATTCSPNSGQRPHVDLELPRHRCFVSGIAFRPASSFFLATLGRSVLSHTLVLPCWEVEHKAKIQPRMGRMGGKKKKCGGWEGRAKTGSLPALFAGDQLQCRLPTKLNPRRIYMPSWTRGQAY